jgi:DNA-binding response OmpR family regulator
MSLSIVLAVVDPRHLAEELASQLTADGYEIHQAHSSRHAVSLIASRHADVLILGALERPAVALALLRDLREGTLDARAWPELPAITLSPLVAGDRELDALRAYEAGRDHHLPAGAGYLHLRAVLQAIARRAHGVTRRVHRVGPIEVDTVAREVRVDGIAVDLSAKEFALLAALAREPRRVFTKDELLRDVWGFKGSARTRTVDSHACRLRRKLSERGARAVVNVWGVGYRLSDIEPPRSQCACAGRRRHAGRPG